MSFTSRPGAEQPGMFTPGALEDWNVNSSDTGSGSESQSLTVNLNNSDSGSGTESQSISVQISSSDSGSGTESQSIVVTLSSSDSGSGTDGQSVNQGTTNKNDSDSGIGTESQNIAVTFSSSDSGSGTESQSLAVTLSSSDTGAGTDSQSVNTGTQKSSSDSGTGTESQSIAVTLPSSDTSSGLDDYLLAASFTKTDTASGTDAVGNVELVSNWSTSVSGHTSIAGATSIVNLIMGPATIYVADFGSIEPLDTLISSSPSSSVWMDIGATVEGVTMHVQYDFDPSEFDQILNKPASRLKRRKIQAATKMAEPSLNNLLYALNSGSVATGSGFQSYSPPFTDPATPLTYRAVLIDGWAPGINELTGRQKRRRVILRKCLSTEDI
ncbi:MAG: hypothetical protein LC723_05760, partial [Actinobacteria bacterium]|nr:hypothetical protein [Actinomycetota bacterium]